MSHAPVSDAPATPVSPARMMLRPTLLLAGLALAGFVLRAGLRRWLEPGALAPGPAGEAGFVLVGAALCAVGVPRQAVAFAGGYGFGMAGGMALALAAQMLGCVADFLWARLLAREWARRRVRQGGRVARLDGFLAAHPFSATLSLRLLPVGSNILLNLLAGVSAIGLAPFLAATLLGYLPQTIVFTLLGTGVQVARGTQIALAVALFALSLGFGLALLGRLRRAPAELPAEVTPSAK